MRFDLSRLATQPRLNGRATRVLLIAVVWAGLINIGGAQTGTFVDRWAADDLRVLSYNVYRDAIFDNGTNRDKLDRVIDATRPDVIALQEIYDHSAAEVAGLLDVLSPLGGGQTWNAWQNTDNVIASPYPFLLTTGSGEHADALIDLPDDVFSWDFFVLNDHLPCCGNEIGRQIEADRIVAWLADARTDSGPGDQIALPTDTPFVVLGDLNIVGSGRPLETLLTGDTELIGPDSSPDWDGTPIADAHPLQNGSGPEDYTWRDDTLEFDPGVLDYILFSDSVLETANRFVLNTTTMGPGELSATGLLPQDVVLFPTSGTFDHLPLVVDFRLRPESAPGDHNRDGNVDAGDYQRWADEFNRDAAPPSDGNGDGYVNAADYTIWRDSVSPVAALEVQAISVPEPVATPFIALGALLALASPRRPI